MSINRNVSITIRLQKKAGKQQPAAAAPAAEKGAKAGGKGGKKG